MPNPHRFVMVTIWVTLFFTASPLNAFAYLDPGSGSFVVQVLVASFLGVAFTVKTFWRSITFKVGQLFSKKETL